MCHDFFREVILALLKSFAHLIAHETSYGDLLTDGRDSFGYELADGLGAVTHVHLLHEADVLVVLLDPAVDHLVDDGVGLGIGLVLRLCDEDLSLLFEFRGRDFLFGHVGGSGSGDVHRDVVD